MALLHAIFFSCFLDTTHIEFTFKVCDSVVFSIFTGSATFTTIYSRTFLFHHSKKGTVPISSHFPFS